MVEERARRIALTGETERAATGVPVSAACSTRKASVSSGRLASTTQKDRRCRSPRRGRPRPASVRRRCPCRRCRRSARRHCRRRRDSRRSARSGETLIADVSTPAAVQAATIASPSWSAPTRVTSRVATPRRARMVATLKPTPPGWRLGVAGIGGAHHRRSAALRDAVDGGAAEDRHTVETAKRLIHGSSLLGPRTGPHALTAGGSYPPPAPPVQERRSLPACAGQGLGCGGTTQRESGGSRPPARQSDVPSP